MRELETNRDAVITIQGGGVFGLTVLGQLQAVIEKHHYTPLALAGTSAGAIVATLLWAGLKPKEIRSEFQNMVKGDPKALLGLLGPFPDPQFDFAAFCDLKREVEENLRIIDRTLRRSAWNPARWVAPVTIYWHASNLKNKIIPLFERRGFFQGKGLEDKIEELLRRASDVPKDITAPNEPLRFRHFADLMRENKEDSYRPPLLLTATNLTMRRLEVISSIDDRYMNVPIAKAVRASAGFPVFFTPRDLPECPDGGWFVDGGVVSNFPVWAFSDAFRQKIQESPIYRHLAPKPWIRIGLRVVDDIGPLPDLTQPGLFVLVYRVSRHW
jgi:NTE family protein